LANRALTCDVAGMEMMIDRLRRHHCHAFGMLITIECTVQATRNIMHVMVHCQ